MNAIIVSCKKCGSGQVPLIPDEDGECPCVQCGARHDVNGGLLVSEVERARIHEQIKSNGNGNGHNDGLDIIQYDVKQLHRRLNDGDLAYGEGCSVCSDCFHCPYKKDCKATFRYGNAKSRRPYFTLTHHRKDAADA